MARELLPDWFRFHIAAYDKATGHLNTLQHGAYFLLIKHYYSTGALPLDDRPLATICKMSTHQWRANRATLAAFFDENWKQDKCEEELKFFRDKSEANAKNGAGGGRAKAANMPRKTEPAAPAPQISEGAIAKKSNGAFESNPLINNDPPLANATISPHRLLESKIQESSSKDAPEPELEATPPKRDDDDIKLVSEVKKALGSRTQASVSHAGLPVIQAFIAEDCDLARDILPELEVVGREATTPLRTLNAGFIGVQIRARRDARLLAERASNGVVVTKVFVEFGSTQWKAWVAAGHKPGLNYSKGRINGRMTEGWWFDSGWPPGFVPLARPVDARPTGEARL